MNTHSERKSYPSDVSDEEWSFVAPRPTLLRADAPQRNNDLCGLHVADFTDLRPSLNAPHDQASDRRMVGYLETWGYLVRVPD